MLFRSTNPDTETLLQQYGSDSDENVLLRYPIRKVAQSLQIKVENVNLRPSINAVLIEATPVGKNLHTKS